MQGCAVKCGKVITPGSRKCAPFCTSPWHDWKTMVPWIGHFNIKCACTSQGKGVLSITFSELSEAALAAAASLGTHLQLYGNTRLNPLVHVPPWTLHGHTFTGAHYCSLFEGSIAPLIVHILLFMFLMKITVKPNMKRYSRKNNFMINDNDVKFSVTLSKNWTLWLMICGLLSCQKLCSLFQTADYNGIV